MNNDPVCNGIINWIVPFLSICISDPLLNSTHYFRWVKCKGDVAATHYSGISRLVCIEPPVCYFSPSEHDVILRIHHCCACSFLFGWPPCQRSDMTLVEVSQHAYNYLFIRTIVLFVFLRNSCEPDMVLVYFCWINSVWVWVWVL